MEIFEITFDLQENCEDRPESPYTPHPVSPITGLLHLHGTLVAINEGLVIPFLSLVNTLFRFS